MRVAADVQGGLTVLRKAGALAEASSRRLEPRAYGTTLVQAAHLHWALSVANCRFFEVPDPKGYLDFGMSTIIEPGPDGCVTAPPGPSGKPAAGLGIAIDWDAVDDATVLVT